MHRLLALLLFPSLSFAEPLAASLITVQDQPMTGTILAADANGITFSPSTGGQVNQPYANLKALNIIEPKDWPSAIAALEAGDLNSAEKQFAALATSLQTVRALKDSYGSQAVFYRLLALRGAGRFKELADELSTLAKAPLALGDLYQDVLNELQAWAALGANDLAAVSVYLKPLEDSAAQGPLPQAPFKPMRPARMASVACLRGLMLEKNAKQDLALLDYHRAITLGFGADKGIASLALSHALDLLDAQLKAKPDSPQARLEGYALACIYRDVLGKGKLPAQWAALAVKPEQTKP